MNKIFTMKKPEKNQLDNFLPFSLSSSLGGKKNNFMRAKKTNPVKQSMHIITYKLLGIWGGAAMVLGSLY